MLVSNWLSALVSRIRRRPRYNSRARRAIRKRWQAIQQNRLATVDCLEDRTLLTAQIIDNGDTGFSQTGTWITAGGNPGFYQSDYSYVDGIGGTGQKTSSWAFTDLTAGTYRISGTWSNDPQGASNMPITISGIEGGDVNMTVSQRDVTQDLFDDGVYWQDLGYFTVDGSGTITVSISDNLTDGYVLAEAYRVEKVDTDSNLSISDVSINENAGTATFTVTSSLAAGSAFSVDFTTADSTATAGSDYTAASGTLNFTGDTAGETQTITVNMIDDTIQESDETFLVNLSNVQATGLLVGLADSQATGTIVNDDYLKIIDNGDVGFSQTGTWITAGGNSSFYQSDYSYVNGIGGTGQRTSSWAFTNLVAGTYRISGTWSNDPQGASNMPITISGVEGGNVNTTVSQRGVIQDLFDDGVYWQDLGYFTVDSNGTITVTISDDQTDGYVLAEAFRLEKDNTDNSDSALSISDVSVNEDAGTATFTVTSSLAAGSAFSVDFATADGSATAGSDYTASSGTLNFAGNVDEETQTITVTLNGDTTVELAENFLVNLSNVQSSSELTIKLLDAQASGTINNDDTTVMSLTNTDVSELEGDSGPTQFSFEVNISNPLDIDFHFWSRAMDNTATEADGDFTDPHIGYWATIAAGATSATVYYSINGDTKLEADEVFNYAFHKTDFYSSLSPQSPLSAAYSDNISFAGADQSTLWATGTILNDDFVKIIDNQDAGFSVTGTDWTYTTNAMHYSSDIYYLPAGSHPGATTSWVFDHLTPGIYRISGHWSTHENWASNTELTVSGIEGGPVTQTVNQETLVADINDKGVDWQDLGLFTVDANGTITVTMANESAEGFVVADAMRIEKFENSLSIDDVSVNEDDGTATFTVTLDGTVQGGLDVDWSTSDGTATGGSDYVASSGTLNFAGTAGETQTITVTLNDDFDIESDEVFLVNLVTSGNVTLTDPEGVATIIDDDSVKIDGTDGADDFQVQMNADGVTLEVWQNSALAFSDLLTNVMELNINGGAGADTFTVDLSNGLPFPVGNINFDGAADGGSVVLESGSYAGSLTTVTHTLNSDTSGTISIDGKQINYTSTGSLADNLDVTNRVFDFLGAAETVTLSDSGISSDGLSRIDSTLGAAITFVNTATVVTVSTTPGSGADVINVTGLDSLNAADITLTGDADDDVTFLTSNTVMGANDLTVAAQTITVNNGISSTSGTILLTATENILLNTGSSLTTVDGGITLLANNGGTAAGTFCGIAANNALIQTTGTGNISLTGFGENGEGIYLYNGSLISSTATGASAGTIALDGTAGTASAYQHGILTINASIISADGAISLTGQGGGDGTGNINFGLYISNTSIASTGTGVNAASITLEGTGGDGIGINRGIGTSAFSLASVDGDISMTGVGQGDAAGSDNEGIVLGAVTSITSSGTGVDAAEISIHGTGGAGSSYHQGLYASPLSSISSDVANISVVTDGDLWFYNDSSITSTSGNIQVTTNYLDAINNGDLTMGGSTVFSSSGGDIDLDAAGDIAITRLSTTGNVTIDSASGSILDNDDTYIDIIAGTAALTAAGSIGTSDYPLTTQIDSYTASSGISDVHINNREFFSISNANANEDGTFTFTVSIAHATDQNLTVLASTSHGTTSAGDLISISNQLVTIIAGQTSATVTVNVIDDSMAEDDETFSVVLSDPRYNGATNAARIMIDDGTATSTITDNDTASLSIDDIIVNEDDGTATLTVTLNNSVDIGFTVDYSAQGNTAISGSDFTLASGQLVFAGTANETQTITVTLTDDSTVEGLETLFVNLTGITSSESRNIIFADSQGEISITDNDSITLSIADRTVDENEGIVTLTLVLDQAVQSGVNVDWSTADGGATAGVDYIAGSGTLNFAGTAGETQTITVTLNDDLVVELNETILVNLTNLVATGNITLAQGILTISNDDGYILDEDAVEQTLNLTGIVASSSELQVLTVTAASDNTTLLPNPAMDYVAGNSTGSLTFTPNSNQYGSATVTITVTDEMNIETTHTFTIVVNPVNDDPAVSAAVSSTVTEDDGNYSLDLLTNASDVDLSDTLNVTDLVLSGGDSMGISVSGNSLDITPGAYNSLALGESEVITYSYNVIDGNGGSVAQTAIITIIGVNDAPLAVADSFTTDEETVLTTGNVLNANPTTADSDQDTSDTIIVSAVTGGTVGAPFALASGALLTLNSGGTFSYDPNGQFESLAVGETATDSFTYTITDSQGGTDIATVTMTINGLNDLVTAQDDSITADEDSTTAGSLFADNGTGIDSDIDANDVFTVSAVSGGSVGTPFVLASGALLTVNTDGTFSYDPNGQYESLAAGETDTDSFTYTIDDGHGSTDTATVTITINGQNDAPEATDDSFTTDEGTVMTTGNVLNANPTTADTDPDTSDMLTVSAVAGGTVGAPFALASGALLTLNSNGTFSYDPNGQYESLAAGETATDSFTYTITDSQGATDTALVTMTINGLNDAPVAVDDSFSTDEATVLTTGNVLNANPTTADSDIESQLFNVTAVTGGTVGAPFALASGALLTLNSNGTFSYDPNGQFESLAAGETDTDSFTYTITDSQGGTDTATVTITVNGLNDLVTAQDDSFSTDEETASAGNLFADNGSDVDSDIDTNDTLTVTAVAGGTVNSQFSLASGALLTVNSDGTFSYDPNSQFDSLLVGQTATDSFTYTIDDGQGSTDTATVTITINGFNNNPVAQDDDITANEDTVAISSLFADHGYGADADPDGASITITEVNDVAASVGNQIALGSGALLTVNSNGSFFYDTNGQFEYLSLGQTATETFTYTIDDGSGLTDTATVTMTINGKNDAPVASDDSFSTGDSEVVSGDLIAIDNGSGLDVDPDSLDELLITQINGAAYTPGLLVLPSGAELIIAADGTFSYDPTNGFGLLMDGDPDDSDSFTYTISDGNGGTSQATVTFTIIAESSSFFAAYTYFSVTEESPVLNAGTNDDANALTDDVFTHYDVLLSQSSHFSTDRTD